MAVTAGPQALVGATIAYGDDVVEVPGKLVASIGSSTAERVVSATLISSKAAQ